MLLLLAHITQNDPYRSPDWRFERALYCYLRDFHRHCNDEDLPTRQAVWVLRGCPEELQPEGVLRNQSDDVRAGIKLIESPPEINYLRQAWLLSGIPIGEVATRMNESTTAIDWYEQLFFDVRHRRSDESAIRDAVIGHLPPPGRPRLRWITLRIAYEVGPDALEAYAPALQTLIRRGNSKPDDFWHSLSEGCELAQLVSAPDLPDDIGELLELLPAHCQAAT